MQPCRIVNVAAVGRCLSFLWFVFLLIKLQPHRKSQSSSTPLGTNVVVLVCFDYCPAALCSAAHLLPRTSVLRSLSVMTTTQPANRRIWSSSRYCAQSPQNLDAGTGPHPDFCTSWRSAHVICMLGLPGSSEAALS
ncbi:hypothetical protein QBC34DRAFT_197409 [Podospora aff. communis PSN243]|uniref:Secreted protein n=1 Tax=Podospora aff. communis PSN243 TaxID=3040156 RepID=A0AAV9G7H1_9PEZI|nr:hypothetical protein QBC34DRAFT_197409 [Podospora aff. communis PSN243]